MGLNTNRWNQIRYTIWAPFYDRIVRVFDQRRRESLRLLDVRAGERVLLVGAGTGADLPFLTPGCVTLATDLTPAMLARARPRQPAQSTLAVMDGHRLGVQTGSCDAAVLHLILAVIPDPALCLREVARTLRPGGRAVVFDKFVRGGHPSLLLRAINLIVAPLFTEVTRNFHDILERSGTGLVIEHDAPALLGGLFRYLVLRKPVASDD
jgi:phosphatidylethanolamine/phosphatidyl-N-methylethanolamine N-methyltransferase